MINIDDFTPLISGADKEDEGKEKSVDDVIRECNEKLLKVKRECEELVEEEKKKAFKEGFQKGVLKAREELEKEFNQKINQIKKDYEERLKTVVVDISRFEEQLELRKREAIKRIEKLFLTALTEILEFLYISPQNAGYVSEKIEEIIDEFSSSDLVSIEVGKRLAPFVKGKAVSVSEELGEGDFRINFNLFSIESSIKEKLELLREEFEREIKKSS